MHGINPSPLEKSGQILPGGGGGGGGGERKCRFQHLNSGDFITICTCFTRVPFISAFVHVLQKPNFKIS